MKFLHFLRKLRPRYDTLVTVAVYRDRILRNLEVLRNGAGSNHIAPVLKSNAYGHGLTLVAKIIDNENLPFIIVDSYHEAMILRNEGIRSVVLIIGYTPLGNILKNKLRNVVFTIVGYEQLEKISKELVRSTDFHLKIDTGMRRQGILLKDIDKSMGLIRNNKSIRIVGICSHLADADGKTGNFTDSQINSWNNLVMEWKKEFPNTKYFHLSATATIICSEKITANVARLGIGLYGIDPTEEGLMPNLKPVLEMKSVISGAKTIVKGDRVGYDITFEAPRAMRIATIPAGYYEGVDRRLSNKGFIKIGNAFCPVIGRVSMNITTIDITAISDIKLDTPVTIISSNPSDKNSFINNAQLAGTIAYELMVHIPQQLRRKIV